MILSVQLDSLAFARISWHALLSHNEKGVKNPHFAYIHPIPKPKPIPKVNLPHSTLMTLNSNQNQYINSLGKSQYINSFGKNQYINSLGKNHYINSLGKNQYINSLGSLH